VVEFLSHKVFVCSGFKHRMPWWVVMEIVQMWTGFLSVSNSQMSSPVSRRIEGWLAVGWLDLVFIIGKSLPDAILHLSVPTVSCKLLHSLGSLGGQLWRVTMVSGIECRRQRRG
jgi:hypothetical protein